MRAFLMALMLCLPAHADEGLSGTELYQFYCSACHGLEADGNGPMAAVMTVQPSNLTGLSARNDGVFPKWRVISRIDGRDPLVSHGSEMPVFGPWFQGRGETTMIETGQMVMTSQPIIDLMGYLEEIQK